MSPRHLPDVTVCEDGEVIVDLVGCVIDDCGVESDWMWVTLARGYGWRIDDTGDRHPIDASSSEMTLRDFSGIDVDAADIIGRWRNNETPLRVQIAAVGASVWDPERPQDRIQFRPLPD